MTSADSASLPNIAARLAGLTPRLRLMVGGVLGVVLATTQPPVGFWPAFFIVGPAVFWLWRGLAPKPAFHLGLGFGSGFFAAALHWIVEPFLVDVAVHGWMAPFAVILLSGGLALFWGAALWLAAILSPRLNTGDGIRAAILLAVCLTGAEFARSYVLTGFPWALPAYGWIDTPIAQTVSIFGPYALSMFTLAAMFTLGARVGRGLLNGLVPGAIVLMLGGAWIWGDDRLSHADETSEGPMIRILQTDVPQADKWTIENLRPNFEMLMEASTRPAATPPAIVIWPESAVTFPLDMATDARDIIATQFANELSGAELITGSLRHNEGPGGELGPEARWRNSIFLLSPEGTLSDPFDKKHLVPFGEYLPLDDLLNRLGINSLAGIGAGIVAGENHVVMTPDGAPPFAPLICYEMIFPGETAAAAVGADWLVLVTNDGWFGDWAGPAQHLAMAQMRAIELGLPIARSANSGYSAMIGPYGRLTASLNNTNAGVIDARLPNPIAPTWFRTHGESITTLSLCLLALLSTSGLFQPKNRPNSQKLS